MASWAAVGLLWSDVDEWLCFFLLQLQYKDPGGGDWRNNVGARCLWYNSRRSPASKTIVVKMWVMNNFSSIVKRSKRALRIERTGNWVDCGTKGVLMVGEEVDCC